MKRILLATDLGVMSPYILTYGIEMARQAQAKLDIVHVVAPMGVFAESIINSYVPQSQLEHLRSAGVQDVMSSIKEQIVDHLRSEFTSDDEDYVGEISVKNGEVADTLLSHIELSGYEFVVMGGHNTAAQHHNALGSTAAKLLQLSSVPVMMIPLSRLCGNLASSSQLNQMRSI